MDAWEATSTRFLRDGFACLAPVLKLCWAQGLWHRTGREESLGQDSGREEAQQISAEIDPTENKFLPENCSH